MASLWPFFSRRQDASPSSRKLTTQMTGIASQCRPQGREDGKLGRTLADAIA